MLRFALFWLSALMVTPCFAIRDLHIQQQLEGLRQAEADSPYWYHSATSPMPDEIRQVVAFLAPMTARQAIAIAAPFLSFQHWPFTGIRPRYMDSVPRRPFEFHSVRQVLEQWVEDNGARLSVRSMQLLVTAVAQAFPTTNVTELLDGYLRAYRRPVTPRQLLRLAEENGGVLIALLKDKKHWRRYTRAELYDISDAMIAQDEPRRLFNRWIYDHWNARTHRNTVRKLCANEVTR